MIVLISGTSGSGKTYIVEQILRTLGPPVGTIPLGPRGKPGGMHWDKPPVCIMGRYGTACGGCDTLSWKGAADDIEQVIVDQVGQGRWVLLEGLLVGTWGVERMARLVPWGLINIHLTTDLEDCLAAVNLRRAARATSVGRVFSPVNPEGTTKKHADLLRVLGKRSAAGVKVEELDRAAALGRVKELLLDNVI